MGWLSFDKRNTTRAKPATSKGLGIVPVVATETPITSSPNKNGNSEEIWLLLCVHVAQAENASARTVPANRYLREVNSLMQQLPDDYGLEMSMWLLQATACGCCERIQKVEEDDLGRRFSELKARKGTTHFLKVSDDTDLVLIPVSG
ncbi:hypothetical protein Tco_0127166 [Tanacetum coccineum]